MKKRFKALDWARGWMLVTSVLVNSILHMPPWFGHAPWDGVHFLDLVFPSFVTLSGVGLAFALAKDMPYRVIVRKFLVLLIAGLIYNAVMDWSVDVSTWRITGILQLYAVLVVVIALLHKVAKTWRGWAYITLLLAICHSLLLVLFAKANCALAVLTTSCNPSLGIDSSVFGLSHMYAGGALGYDAEGLVTIFGSLISASAGVTIGHVVREKMLPKSTGSFAASLKPILITILALLVAALFFQYVFGALFGAELPVMKKLWTAPFALYIAVTAGILVALGYFLLDWRDGNAKVETLSKPLESLGRNSLLVYFGSHVLTAILARSFFEKRSVQQVFEAVIGHGVLAQLVWSAVLLGFWVLLAIVLHKRKIYIKA